MNQIKQYLKKIKRKFTYEQKLKIVKFYLKNGSFSYTANYFKSMNLTRQLVFKWVNIFKVKGKKGLKSKLKIRQFDPIKTITSNFLIIKNCKITKENWFNKISKIYPLYFKKNLTKSLKHLPYKHKIQIFELIHSLNRKFFIKHEILFKLFRVTTKTFYKWKKNDFYLEEKNQWLDKLVLEEFNKSKKTYGCLRLSKKLSYDWNKYFSKSKIYKSMKRQNLKSLYMIHTQNKRPFIKKITSVKELQLTKPNLIYEKTHQFTLKKTAVKQLEYIFTDTTFLKPLNQFMIAFIDGYSRQVLHYNLFNQKTTHNVAISIKKLSKKYDLNNTIIHSDRGSEFRSFKIQKLSNKFNFKQSMTLPYSPQQNSIIEKYFMTLKYEHFKFNTKKFKSLTYKQHIYKLKNYINYYNNDRFHCSIENYPVNLSNAPPLFF